jgi:hypothetical protein
MLLEWAPGDSNFEETMKHREQWLLAHTYYFVREQADEARQKTRTRF